MALRCAGSPSPPAPLPLARERGAELSFEALHSDQWLYSTKCSVHPSPSGGGVGGRGIANAKPQRRQRRREVKRKLCVLCGKNPFRVRYGTDILLPAAPFPQRGRGGALPKPQRVPSTRRGEGRGRAWRAGAPFTPCALCVLCGKKTSSRPLRSTPAAHFQLKQSPAANLFKLAREPVAAQD